MFAPDHLYGPRVGLAPFDRFVALARAVSEVALDVFGTVFWASIAVLAARAYL